MKKIALALTALAMTSGMAFADASGDGGPGGSTSALDIRQQSIESQTVTSQDAYALQARRSAGDWRETPQPIHKNSRDFAGNR